MLHHGLAQADHGGTVSLHTALSLSCDGGGLLMEMIGGRRSVASSRQTAGVERVDGQPRNVFELPAGPSRVFHGARQAVLGFCGLNSESSQLREIRCQWHWVVFVRLKDDSAIGMGPRWSKDSRRSRHPGRWTAMDDR